MVLVTLCLGLELMQRKVVAPPEMTSKITAQLAATAAEAESLRAKLAESRRKIDIYSKFDSEAVRRELSELTETNKRLVRELSDSERERERVKRQEEDALKEKNRRASDPQTLAELRQQIQDKQEQLERLKRSNQLLFNRPEGETKAPWLVQVGAAGLLAAEVGKRARPQSFRSAGEFRAWLGGRQRSREYFVILVQPDGVPQFPEAYQTLLDLHFDVGLDLLVSGQTAIDPESGAVPR